MNCVDMKQEIARFLGRLEEMRKSLGEVVLVRIHKNVNKIDENVAVISGTMDKLRSILYHKTNEDQLESEIYT